MSDTNHITDPRRREFIKGASASAVLGGLGIRATDASAATPEEKIDNIPMQDMNTELHICRGLNLTAEGGKGPGECDTTNIPAADLHGCAGGNTCKGLGGCGTGDYAQQYWTADNACGRKGSAWTGSGGCGVPIGSTNTGFICSQLNNAVPTQTENPDGLKPVLVGVPVWAIARARFEKKMVQDNKSFGVPNPDHCGDHKANSWSPGNKYDRGSLPEPYPKPIPPRKLPS